MQRFIGLIAVSFFLTGSLCAQDWNGYDELNEQNSLREMVESVPEAAKPSKIGALLLTSKLVIEGESVLEGDYYITQTKFGRSRQPKSAVEYAAESTTEIYRYVQGKTNLGDFKKVVEFAQWCRKNNLRSEALEEFARAKTLAPDVASLKMIDDLIRLNRLDRPAELPGTSVATEKAVAPEDEGGFDYTKWGKTVPPSVYNSFTKTAQPILLSRCATADCHGANSDQEYKLYQTAGPEGRLKTLQNLKATLGRLNIDNPDESTILAVAVRAHGGCDPMLNKRTEKQFQALYAWTHQAAQLLPKPLPSPSQREQQLISPRAPVPKNNEIRQVAAWTPAEESENSPVYSGGRKNGNTATNATRPNRVAPRPIDPYDPAIFNEKYHVPE